MAFLQVQFFSAALNVASTVNVILPEANQGIGMGASRDERLPKVLYLLHNIHVSEASDFLDAIMWCTFHLDTLLIII